MQLTQHRVIGQMERSDQIYFVQALIGLTISDTTLMLNSVFWVLAVHVLFILTCMLLRVHENKAALREAQGRLAHNSLNGQLPYFQE